MDTITINSGHVANSLDSQIILLVKTIQIENKVPFDDALETGRDFLNQKVIQLMNEKDKELITKIANDIKTKYKNNPNNNDIKSMYSLCKYFGLYKHLE